MGICTDRAASMIGKHSGSVARIREVPNIIEMHCMIHHKMLVAKHLRQSLSEVFVYMCQNYKLHQSLSTTVSDVFEILP